MPTALLVVNVLAWTAALGFVATYGLMAPWRSTALGRSIFVLSVGVLLITTGGLLRRADEHDAADWLLLAGYTVAGLALLAKTTIVGLLQISNARHDSIDGGV